MEDRENSIWEESRRIQFNKLNPLEYKNQRIMTTKTLAEQYGTEETNIKNNFNNNKGRFIEGKHYYQLRDEKLKEFKRVVNDIDDPSIKFASVLTLWTEKGAARHAKILDTDEAWEVYEVLEETYFRVKQLALNTSQLSPELQMFNNIFNAVAKIELNNKQLKEEVQAVRKEAKEEIQGIRDVITLDHNSWREDCRKLIAKIASKLGSYDYISDVTNEIYSLMRVRLGANLETRLTNKRRRMAEEGVCKSKRDKLRPIDVIADDKKLIEGYKAIVKEMAIKYGVA